MLVEHEAVVEVAADGARGLEHRFEREARLGGEDLARRGQEAHLDAPRRRELPGDPRLRLAQEPPLAIGFGERCGKERGEEDRCAERRGGNVQKVAGAEADEACRREAGNDGGKEHGRHPGSHRRHGGD